MSIDYTASMINVCRKSEWAVILAGGDGTSLFITSNTNVYRLKLTTKSAGF